MMKELSKFGCKLPQFAKIGGILANELPVDEAALHAAVIAINDAIQKKVSFILYSFPFLSRNCRTMMKCTFLLPTM